VGSESARIGSILADPDRDRDRHRHSGPADPNLYPFQPNAKLTVLFSRTFKCTVQDIENYDTYEGAEKEKTM
jgi:hypothetical protein